MDDHLTRERRRRRTGRTHLRLYENYVSVILNLCKQNNIPERMGLFTKLYSLLVMSGLLFPYSAGGVAWELIEMMEDVKAMAKYNWSKAVWSFLVEAIEEMKEKIHTKKNYKAKNLQIHGFAMILQVWFYKHTNLYPHAEDKCVSRIASWVNLYTARKYDAMVLISSIKDNQVG
ncbi:hypothetical protein Cgig2_002648 [Carnegiea gigantea]|uniref:Aminotransferase-like plant mobile domain-containing protein n=1 Tax=Carnegiea gigantea TaxID=171969 RepID=A0A9Q1GK99_9CARY|nr:hypothetical protein Cgig2_002648 [Carnegiea gigantea]